MIQVTTSFAVAGPAFIAGDDPLAQGPMLRRVNRLLARVQRPKRVSGTALLVIGPGDEVVRFEDVKDLERGRGRALSIAAEITAGTFVAS